MKMADHVDDIQRFIDERLRKQFGGVCTARVEGGVVHVAYDFKSETGRRAGMTLEQLPGSTMTLEAFVEKAVRGIARVGVHGKDFASHRSA